MKHKALIKARRRNGYMQKEVAQLVGISLRAYQKYENEGPNKGYLYYIIKRIVFRIVYISIAPKRYREGQNDDDRRNANQ